LAAAECNDFIGVADGPAHAGRFEPLAGYGFATRFYNAGTDKQTLASERRVSHPLFILFEVVHCLSDLVPRVVSTPSRNVRFPACLKLRQNSLAIPLITVRSPIAA